MVIPPSCPPDATELFCLGNSRRPFRATNSQTVVIQTQFTALNSADCLLEYEVGVQTALRRLDRFMAEPRTITEQPTLACTNSMVAHSASARAR
jgi:hypothetical protein